MCVFVWVCVAVWLCGCVAVWLCGCVAVRVWYAWWIPGDNSSTEADHGSVEAKPTQHGRSQGQLQMRFCGVLVVQLEVVGDRS